MRLLAAEAKLVTAALGLPRVLLVAGEEGVSRRVGVWGLPAAGALAVLLFRLLSSVLSLPSSSS